MIPKFAAPSVARGSAKFAVLVRLNPSDRNCSLKNSRIWNGLKKPEVHVRLRRAEHLIPHFVAQRALGLLNEPWC